MPVIDKSVAFVCIAFLLGAFAGPAVPSQGSSPPGAAPAREETAPNTDARQPVISACSRLTEAGSSPFPFPTELVATICECAAARLESNERVQRIARALPAGTPSATDSERNYFVAKFTAAALSCLGNDLDKIAEDESQLAQPGVTSWLSALNASTPVVWPVDTGPTHSPKILVPSEEEARRGKKGCLKPPQYPEIAARKDVTGTVTMAFLVDPDGRVRKARVVHSSGETPSHKVLDATALAYLGDCEFRPGTVDGVAVQSWAKVQYVWKLK